METKDTHIEAPLDAKDEVSPNAKSLVHLYLMKHSDTYRKLTELRNLGWKSEAGDTYFKEQRERADNADKEAAKRFFRMMQNIARELNHATGVFNISRPSETETPSVLDWCMAPGGFLSAAQQHNRGVRCRAFSLPRENGGHEVLLSPSEKLAISYLDLNFLAADMGVEDIPRAHAEAASFLPRQLAPDESFDLVICDGQVLRTHRRPAHRERLESARLTLVQLALGLQHVREGGRMAVLLHKVEAWDSLQLLYAFGRFAAVRLFKPRRAHTRRSTCYFVASGIEPRHPDAIKAVRDWKEAWRVATFGTCEEYGELVRPTEDEVEKVLGEFGPRLIELATDVWEVQAAALEAAPWIRT